MAAAYDHDSTTDHDESDAHSVGAGTLSSTTSKDRVALECPECKKELQSRNMFNHIRKLHPEYFKMMYKVWKADDLQELIDECRPFPMEWTYKNDFDEDEFVNIWGCLACNSTFTQEKSSSCLTHCKKAKCKKEHIKALKAIKKEEEKDLAARNKKATDKRTKWLNRTPEQVFDDTRIFLTYYKAKYLTKLYDEFKNYYTKLDGKEEADKCLLFDYNWDIKLTSDKNEMVEQELRIEKQVAIIRGIYINILKKLYNAPTIVCDDVYINLDRAVNWVQDFPKMSCD